MGDHDDLNRQLRQRYEQSLIRVEAPDAEPERDPSSDRGRGRGRDPDWGGGSGNRRALVPEPSVSDAIRSAWLGWDIRGTGVR
jgi:hypothetical protein